MLIELTAPFTWNCAVFNAGERLLVPDDLAQQLIDAGGAVPVVADLVTDALDGPPANKMMQPAKRKRGRPLKVKTGSPET